MTQAKTKCVGCVTGTWNFLSEVFGGCSWLVCLKAVWSVVKPYVPIVQGFIPLADFASDFITVYAWHGKCQGGEDEFCLWWKLGTLFICLPSVIGPLFCLLTFGL